MLPTRIDQTEQGLGRLISALQEKENVEKILEIYLKESQEIEDASLEFAEQKNINTAAGIWLDYIGSIVGQVRGGRSDAEYRTALLLKIQTNTADGTPNTIISLVQQFTEGTDVRIRDFTIAASTLYTNGTINIQAELLVLVDNIKPAGVRIIIHTDVLNNAMLPSWEVDLPVVEFLEVTDPILPPPALTFLELYDGVDADIMSVITGLGTTYYRPDTTRSIPFWEQPQQLQGVTQGEIVDITGVSQGEPVNIEVFTVSSNTTTPLCWEVVPEASLLAY